MTAKLNQVIAIEKGAKNRLYSAITELHKNAQKFTSIMVSTNQTNGNDFGCRKSE